MLHNDRKRGNSSTSTDRFAQSLTSPCTRPWLWGFVFLIGFVVPVAIYITIDMLTSKVESEHSSEANKSLEVRSKHSGKAKKFDRNIQAMRIKPEKQINPRKFDRNIQAKPIKPAKQMNPRKFNRNI